MSPVGELLAEWASGPDLHGAACAVPRNRAVFDRAVQRGPARFAATEAAAICTVCPVLEVCRSWRDSLPPDQVPAGVVAGVQIGSRVSASSASRQGGGARHSRGT